METDKMKKMTVLKAVVAPWSTVAGMYSMGFGKAYILPT
jgi:Mg2+ and Co2+ transporter CorA